MDDKLNAITGTDCDTTDNLFDGEQENGAVRIDGEGGCRYGDKVIISVLNDSNQDCKINSDGVTKKKKGFFSVGNIAVMGILTALAFVLYVFVKFPLPILFPSWLDIQFSDLPALLGGFALGPVAGCVIIVLKCCLKMPMTSTACVGEFADIIVGIAFVLPASLIYRRHKSKKSAIVGMMIGTACAVGMSVLANRFVLIPFYAKNLFGDGDYLTGLSKIVGMVNVLYDGVTTDIFYSYYLPLAVVPFNVLRCGICATLTYFTYKPLSKVLHWEIRTDKDIRKDDCD